MVRARTRRRRALHVRRHSVQQPRARAQSGQPVPARPPRGVQRSGGVLSNSRREQGSDRVLVWQSEYHTRIPPAPPSAAEYRAPAAAPSTAPSTDNPPSPRVLPSPSLRRRYRVQPSASSA